MISPGFHSSPENDRQLLREEQALLDMLGWTEEEYRWFEAQKATFAEIRPGDPVAFIINPATVALVLTIIGTLLQVAAQFFAPTNKPGPPARLEQKTDNGQSIIKTSRFAPTAGFDSQQNVVELGSIVPVIFAKRETIDGVTYGGVRINTNLLWSQLYSLGGSQLIKALFLVGNGPIGSIDPKQFAIGDNLLSSYNLQTADNNSGRLTFYYRNNGGRIRSTDIIAGRSAANDVANSENAGGADVFQIRSVNGIFQSDFCYAGKPSTQTTFGLYAPIGNDLAYRINPTVRSISVAGLSAVGDNGNAIVRCNDDTQLKAERDKQNVHFSTRSGITGFNGTNTTDGTIYTAAVNNTITYLLSSIADNDTEFLRQDSNGPDGKATCEDVAQSISGLQRSWDDALIIGELYRIGSCIAILDSRSPADGIFVSRVDNDPVGAGRDVTCVFRVVRAGQFRATSFAQISEDGTDNTEHRNGTSGSHIFRLAVASFTIDRPAQILEIGFRSSIGLRLSGLCNFPSCKTYQEADNDSCERYENKKIFKGDILKVSNFQSGTYTGPETRYSFFRLSYRIAGSDAAYTPIPQLFGFRSMTGQSSFNYIRIQLPSAQRWEIEAMPISGWEIRNNYATGDLEVLDSKIQSVRTVYGSGCAMEFNGVQVARQASTFAVKATQSDKDIGLFDKDGKSYADAWGKLAEQFIFPEITATTDSTEHEISYVNLVTRNATAPQYENLAIIGATIRSGPELSSFQQLSTYINEGFGSTHLIGDVMRHFILNSVFGLGSIVSTQQVDDVSFDAANTWTYNRRYFFDGGVSEPLNIRQKGAEWSEYFLLDLLIRGGKFYLQPTANFDTPHTIGAMYTAGNVSDFEFSIADPMDRIPPRVTVRWREEKQSSDIAGRGLFPVVREVTVREIGTPADAPIEQIDLSDIVTNEVHAIDVAKMRCRKKRLITSRVRLTTRPDRAAFDPGKIIKVGMETVKFDLPQNGAILEDGTVISIPSGADPITLADGTYNALIWTGIGDIQSVPLDVTEGKNTTYAGSVYSLANIALSSQTFKIQTVDFTADGDVEASALEFPLDEAGNSLLTVGWDVDSNWIIEGRLGTFNENIVVVPSFNNVTILGESSLPASSASTYSASVSGPSGAYVYTWTCPGATITGSTTASCSITFGTAGTYTVTCLVTLSGTTRTGTLTVNVGAVVVAPTLGLVTITGPNVGSTAVAYTYTAATANTVTGTTWEWVVEGGAGNLDPTDTDNSIDLTFPSAGTYTVRAKAIASTASDNPSSAFKLVTIT
jgi:hypothetical protein